MTEFTRLTVIGSARKADLVVPNDEAVAGLMPRLMDLLDEPTGSVVRPLTLVRTTGEQLDVALTIADQQRFRRRAAAHGTVRRRSAPTGGGRCDRRARRVTARPGRTLVALHPRAHRCCCHRGARLRSSGSTARGPACRSSSRSSCCRWRPPSSDEPRCAGSALPAPPQALGIAANAAGSSAQRFDLAQSLRLAAAVLGFAVARLAMSRSRLWPGFAFSACLVRQSGRHPGLCFAADHGAALGSSRR